MREHMGWRNMVFAALGSKAWPTMASVSAS